MTNDKADFTQGNILKKLVAFMMPVLGALILQAAYGAVDLLVVGRFGSTSGLSAVSTGSRAVYCYGRFCTSDLRADAGTGRSGSADCILCTDLWQRNFLYCCV